MSVLSSTNSSVAHINKRICKLLVVETLGKRLALARQKAGLSQADLAQRAGIKQQSVQAIENGRVRSTAHILKFAQALNVDPGWLDTGQGEMEAKPRAKSRTQDAPPTGVALIPEHDVRISAGGGGLPPDEVEVVGRWGFPAEWMRYELRARADELSVFTVDGDSMAPTLIPGDKVLMNRAARTPSPPGIFVLWDGMGQVAKRLEFVPNSDPPTIRVLSDNPRYSPYERTLDEIWIVGRVVGRWERL